MPEWQPINTAPHDGTLVWVTYQTLVPLAGEVKNAPRFVVLARFDSWNTMWRMTQSGKNILPPDCRPPDYWQPCDVPKAPNATEPTSIGLNI